MRKGYESYDPNAVGVDNGNFLGLPIVDDPKVKFIAVPFDATVSYGTGTSGGPANMLLASAQLDASILGLENPWELGFSWTTLSCDAIERNAHFSHLASLIIESLEMGKALNSEEKAAQKEIAAAGENLAQSLNEAVSATLNAGIFPVVVGGEHAISLGAFQACAKTGDFGILQLDAHMDLREAYEGFTYSHASIMHNALCIPQLTKLVQVGIRDFCPQEQQRVVDERGRVSVFYDRDIQHAKFEGEAFAKTAQSIIDELPQRVWISFDIDGLDPSLCAHTGTPVPGGLSFAEAQYLLQKLVESGREIIGLDLVEIASAPFEYEGSVAARLAYDLACRAVLQSRQR